MAGEVAAGAVFVVVGDAADAVLDAGAAAGVVEILGIWRRTMSGSLARC